METHHVWLLVKLVTILALCAVVRGQGLLTDREAVLGSQQAVYSKLKFVYSLVPEWKQRYAQGTVVARRQQCKGTGTLCSSATDRELEVLLKIATAPERYNAKDVGDAGGFSGIGAVQDQGNCNRCVDERSKKANEKMAYNSSN